MLIRIMGRLAAAALCVLPAVVVANVPAGSVLSGSIRPADGSTDQDVTTGSGVKTNHIQDGAVTTEKIAPGAITPDRLAPGGVSTENIAPGAVTSEKIAPGAVTDGNIAGPVSASKIEQGVFQKRYANVVTVAKSGGDFTDPSAAMASITDASAANPYLLKIMPGLYDLASPVRLKEHVDVEGSGQNTTILSWVSDGSWAGVITSSGVNAAEVRDVTLRVPSASAGNLALGVVVGDGSPRLTRVTVEVQVAGCPTNLGLRFDNSSSVLDHVTVRVSGGVGNRGIEAISAIQVYDSRVEASDGYAFAVYAGQAWPYTDVIRFVRSSARATGDGPVAFMLGGLAEIEDSTLVTSATGWQAALSPQNGSTVTVRRSKLLTSGGGSPSMAVYSNNGIGVPVVTKLIHVEYAAEQVEQGDGSMVCRDVLDANLNVITCPP